VEHVGSIVSNVSSWFILAEMFLDCKLLMFGLQNSAGANRIKEEPSSIEANEIAEYVNTNIVLRSS
jgi:hypothetical protein